MAIIMADAYFESLKQTTKCPICGKQFVPAAQHMWKIGNWDGVTGERTVRVCSYSCMTKWEKEHDAKDKKKRHDRRSSHYEYRYKY